MLIELVWTVSASDMGASRCCVCGRAYERGAVHACVLTDDRFPLGEACPPCLEAGAGYMERGLHRGLRRELMMREADLRARRKALGECLAAPTYAEFSALLGGAGGPRYASSEEAQAAWKRGEW